MDEREALDKLINVLTEHNLVLGKDYVFKNATHGCFNIAICPHRYAVIDFLYFYDNVPDIKVFKAQQKGDYINLLIKIKIRSDKCD